MKKTLIVAIALALGTTSAYAGGYNKNYNKNYNSAGAAASAGASAGAAAIGVNKNYNRNSVKSYNHNWNDTRVKTRTSTYQGQGQNQFQGQDQANIGLGSGNSTDISYEGDTVTYEAPKKPDIPAYAPDAVAAPATAPCYKTWAASGGGLGLVSLGGSGYVKDHGCAFGEVARRAHAQGNTAVAEEALMHMMRIVKEEAGVTDTKPATTVKATPVKAARNDGAFDWQRSYD